MSVYIISYAYSLESDASCLKAAPRAASQCQASQEIQMNVALVSPCGRSRVHFHSGRLRWNAEFGNICPNGERKMIIAWSEAVSSGVTSSIQDAKHGLHSSLDSLLNVSVLLQMRRICWRSFSITLQHLSHHRRSVRYNKALFQAPKKKAPSCSCFTWHFLHPITGLH